jgi:hypothetical protein
MPTMQGACRYDGARSHIYQFTGKERDTESGLDISVLATTAAASAGS